MKAFLGLMAVVLAGFAQGVVAIKENSVKVTSDPATRRVTVAYELEGDDAVVTFDVLKGDSTIGGEFLKNTSGDICKVLSAGPHEFIWYADTGWCDNVALGAVTVKVEAWALDNPPAYMVCDLVRGSRHYYPYADALPGEGGVTNDIYKTAKLVMRKIPAKGVQWRMGKLSAESAVISNAETQHYVTFEDDYYIGVFEFTYGQRNHVKDEAETAATAWLQTYPMTNQSWSAMRGTSYNTKAPTDNSIIGCLRSRVGNIEFDLTMDEQWEYACRAGTSTRFANGTDTDPDAEMGWYSGSGGAHPVGLKKANGWGLYDMHGNVWEHCLDGWHLPDGTNVVAGLYSDGGSNAQKVARGGGFAHNAKDYARSACRINRNYNGSGDLGFRVACPAVAK